MDPLVQYNLPLKGLREGTHRFTYRIDQEFFRHFEDSPVGAGKIDLVLRLDKRPGLYVLEFEIEGTVKTECDRCLAGIDLPIGSNQRLLLKLAEEEKGEEAEVVYVHPEIDEFNVARYIYEFVVLAVPMIKVYDCEAEEPRKCNFQMLAYLEQPGQEEAPESNPVWDELKKKLKINQN